jgi:hypothetical protein
MKHSTDPRSSHTLSRTENRTIFNKNQPPESENSQRAKILGLLIAARGQWVPLSEISACACQYGARIFEARRLGFRIENCTKEIDGVRRSWFRLISSPAQASSPASPAAADRVVAVNSQTKSDGDVMADPRARREETLPLFPEGDR